MKRILLQLMILGFCTISSAQTQIGSNITGGVAGARFGHTVSLNSAGTKVAVGAPFKSSPNTINGFAQVYNDVSNTWVQSGATLNGENAQDNFGRLSLSGDGNTLVVGGSTNDGNGTDSGHVRVFTWNGTAWIQKGVDINGEAAGDNFGVKVDVSDDGSVIAVGANLNDGTASNAGHVRVFTWNGTAWIQRGTDINGEAIDNEFGAALALNSDGTRLVVGARFNDSTATNDGEVSVYNWNGTAWVQLGVDLNGGLNHLFGYSVDINNTGSRIIVGAVTGSSEYVKIFDWNGTAWTQVGSNLTGQSATSRFGISVAMNGTGNTITVGEANYDVPGGVTDDNSGRVTYYKYNGTAWIQHGNSVSGTTDGEGLGTSVAISDDGNTVIIGVPFNATAHAKVYDFTGVLSTNDFTLNNKFQFYPNPAQDSFSMISEVEIEKVEIYSLQGQLVKSFNQSDVYSISDLATGIYSVIISSEEGKGVKKLIKQ
jgi:Secretion system C-terminal sorting domain